MEKKQKDEEWSERKFGILIKIKSEMVLITKLSHGWRVINIEDSTQYRYTKIETIQVSKKIIKEATTAYSADRIFQTRMEEFRDAPELEEYF